MILSLKTASKSGMTLVEVLIATVLMTVGLATFLASFSSVQRVSVTADNNVNAMHRAREIMEAVMAHGYHDTALNIGRHTLPDDASYTVSLASEFRTTKNIKVTVAWKNPKGATLYVELNGSMAECIHQQ